MPTLHEGAVLAERAEEVDLHPTRAELEDFMLGKLSQRDSRRVILHLLPGCAQCQEVTSAFWYVGEEMPVEMPERFRYERSMNLVLDRVRSARVGLEAERAAAGQLLAELRTRPRDLWPALVQSDARFHTWGFCERLLDCSRTTRDLGEAGLCAGLTVNLAGRIDTSVHPDLLVQELTARAWMALADVWRQAGDFRSAEESLRRAEAHLLRGTGDRLEKARLLERKAALRLSQERPDDAARLLSRAILLYRRLGQWDQVGRILVDLGCIGSLGSRGLLRIWLDRLRRLSARLSSLPSLSSRSSRSTR
jgi:tetratricopeptide (TPR) repeat protein